MLPHTTPEHEKSLLEIGFDAILSKPPQLRSLLTLLFGDEKHNILHQRGSLTEEEAQSLSLSPRPPYLEPAQLLRDLFPVKAGAYDKNEAKFLLARAALKKLRSRFDNESFEYERTLGYGGFGIAAKYSQKNTAGQHMRHVVVKAPVKADHAGTHRSLQREHAWYEFMRGMEHVPYLVDPLPLYRLPTPDSDQPAERLDDYKFPGSDESFLLTEFLEHGELCNLIERLNEAALAQPGNDMYPKLTFIPNRLLWRLFLCLVRQCLAMGFPYAAAAWRTYTKQEDPEVTEEELDDMLVKEPYSEEFVYDEEIANVVHFNVDIYNVFLGQSNNPEDKEHEFFRAVTQAFLRVADTWTYKTNLDAIFTYPSGKKVVVPETYAYFLENEDLVLPGPYGRYDVELRYTVATLMARSLDVRGTLDLLYLNVTAQIEDGNQKAEEGKLPDWERDAGLHEFINDHLKNAPEKEFAAGKGLEEPTPPPPP
ncbi:kinase-like domain-containing protein [Apiospora phragmitis]|uniref:Kinase-like domain-containing protein n=1 Tax=Apiospora phragmitis TaxID=2905665 RepID=A0ABR1URC7_9PEZI